MSIRPKRKNISQKSLLMMGIPKYLCNMDIVDFEVGDSSNLNNVKLFVEKFIMDLDSHLKNGDGIFFCGSNGVGKTMLSCIILKEAYRHRFTCRRISFAKYIDYYTDSWGEEIIDNYEVYRHIDFLVLEEVGKEIDSKIAKPILEDLLRYRQENNKSTIICSNLTPEDFKNSYGNSISSLINGSMIVIKINAKDKRKEGLK